MKKILLHSLSGAIISEHSIGEIITQQIKAALAEAQFVEIDFAGIKAITTFTSKQIFGNLYLSMGNNDFFKKLYIKNATDTIKRTIKSGVQDALEEKEHINCA